MEGGVVGMSLDPGGGPMSHVRGGSMSNVRGGYTGGGRAGGGHPGQPGGHTGGRGHHYPSGVNILSVEMPEDELFDYPDEDGELLGLGLGLGLGRRW